MDMLANTPLVDLSAFSHAALKYEPYKYVIAPNFVPADALREIERDFPRINRAGSFPLASVKGGTAFQRLIAEIEAPEMRRAIEEKFSIDLTGRPTMITVRGRSRLRDGQVHTDSESKLITVLIYLNREWNQPGGRLRLLRDKNNLENYAAEIEPTGGTLLAFERSNKSFHGHLPCEGVRRSVQLNWVKDQSVVAHQYRRHGLSAIFKRLWPSHVPD
jgi:hypothetical protein